MTCRVAPAGDRRYRWSMDVLLLEVPYDSGHHRVRMGRGPTHLVGSGAAARLGAAGHTVAHREVRVESPLPLEMGTGFAVIRAIAAEVAGARARGEFPLVLAGNCNSAIGTVSGLGDPSVGILWFDAHGDCETPETTESGYFDVIDPSIAPANVFAEPDGLFPDGLAAVIRQAAARFPVAGAGLASYDPSCDREDRMLGVGLDLIETLPARR